MRRVSLAGSLASMRGSPPLHLLVFTLLFALLVVPLSHLTATRPQPPGAHGASLSSSNSSKVHAIFRLRTAHPAEHLSLTLNGEELIPEASRSHPPTQMEIEHQVPNPHDGFELALQATWPSGTPDTVVSVEAEPDEFDAKSQFQWSNHNQAAGTFLFRW